MQNRNQKKNIKKSHNETITKKCKTNKYQNSIHSNQMNIEENKGRPL